MNKKDENSYGMILKRIFSFGGVQVFNVLVNLVRGKLVAVILGSGGMGLNSLFNSATLTIQQLGGLGLNLALVKEVAANKESGDLQVVITTGVRLITFTSLFAGTICFLLSPLLSLWSFGSYDYTISFMALAASVCLGVGGTGYLAMLQGAGQVKRLSKASIVGGLTGLCCGVPLYYFFGYSGIVPAIIILSLAIFLFNFFSFRGCIEREKVSFSWSSHRPIVKKLISLGFVLMIGSLCVTLTNYIINIFVRIFGSVEDVGFFQAANSMTSQYVGVIFSALALDYFPRLSAIGNDSAKLREVVNRQADIVTLIMTPLVLILLLTAPWLIRLLLSKEFLVVTPLMRWLGLGVLIQAITFPLSYILISKDNKKIYIWLEVVMSNVVWIGCSIGFYYLFSLIGLGISLVVRSAIDIPVYYLVCKKLFGFDYTPKTALTLLICLAMGVGGFLLTLLPESQTFIWLPILLAISIAYSFVNLKYGLKKDRNPESPAPLT